MIGPCHDDGECSECYVPARCIQCSGPIPNDEDSARPLGNDFCCYECKDEFGDEEATAP